MTDFTPPTAPPTFEDSSPMPGSSNPSPNTGRIGPDSSPGGSGGSKLWIFALVAIAAAGGAAYFTGSGEGSTEASVVQSVAGDAPSAASEAPPSDAAPSETVPQVETAPSETPSSETVPAAPEASDQAPAGDQTAAVLVEGGILDQMPNTGGPTTPDIDSAIGQVAPTLTGFDFDGNPITIGPDGRPKAIYFLAHWCPHCQVEMPTIQGLVDAGSQPANLDIYAVSTALAPDRGNYPPQTWFEAEKWSSPVMLDNDDSSALINFGAGGFPYVVFLDGDNQVLTRAAGEMPAELMLQVWEAVASTS